MTDDMNRMVAEACGFNCRTETCKVGEFLATEVYGQWCVFNPQNSAHDAVLAAEKFGLFDDKYITNLQRYKGVWSTWITDECGDAQILGSGTFCEAICQAIVYLHDNNTAT